MTGPELLALAIATVFLVAMLTVEWWLARRAQARRIERNWERVWAAWEEREL